MVSNLANRIKAATGAGGWKEAPAATLASLSTMIANLATGADVTWDGKKFTNHRLGITGLMDQNGYICFGPNCGGLIIQWVSTNTPGGNVSIVALPIAYTQWYKIVATGVVDSLDADFKQTVAVLKDYNMSLQSFAIRTSGQDKPAAFCITIGV